jgi:hypothetical protein
MHICESDLPAKQFIIEAPCEMRHRQYIRRSNIVEIGHRQIVITVRYEHSLKPLGFSLGRHIYSITLVPGEEIELEIFRSAKLSEELSREYSTEETYSQEFANTIHEEWSTKETSNFKIGGGVSASLDLVIFKVGGHAEPEYSTSTEQFHKSFVDFSTKTSAKVDRKFDVHIDVKSERSESTRSTRRLRNFNQCQTVTYHYFQIARRFKATLKVVDVRFDVVPPREIPLVYASPLRALAVSYRIEPPRPNEVLSRPPEVPAGVRGAVAMELRSGGAAAEAGVPTSTALSATLLHPTVGSEFLAPVRELTLDQVLAELHLATDEGRDLANGLKKMLDGLHLHAGSEVAACEFCIPTAGLYADSMTGACAACDTHTVQMQELERQKLEAEVKQAGGGQ